MVHAVDVCLQDADALLSKYENMSTTCEDGGRRLLSVVGKVYAKEVKSTWEQCSFRKDTSCSDQIFFVR